MGTDFVAIDFETANYDSDSACSIGLVKVRNGKIMHKTVQLIRPPSQRFVFSYIHGLTWKDVAHAPTFGEYWPTVTDLFDDARFVAAHNARFDQRVLLACCNRYKVKAPALPFACSMDLARKTWGIYPTKLSDVCRHLRIKLNHHEALSDAMACAQIILASENEVTKHAQRQLML